MCTFRIRDEQQDMPFTKPLCGCFFFPPSSIMYDSWIIPSSFLGKVFSEWFAPFPGLRGK